MYKKGPSKLTFVIPAVVIIVMLFFLLIPSESQKVQNVIESFYTYEQEARFSLAYDLFHPKMQETYSRANYIENRGRFIGVEGFPFSLSKPEKVSDWSMTEGVEPLDSVYKVTVTKEIRDSQNGNYRMEQDVYVAEELETGEWKVLWDFN
ncbi:hypothetical protein N0O92_09155 [Alkalihalobacillus sp. MEB130]|uniref:hypothetical protein n=1 Tax=Alkalihalobacillus sp. MEB130 TaxID=2976704 RepID=UPI0028DFD4E7|nr:hypothetical protein [Alkalihalobacillus sp. MEB130]MDT8860401.1 hypothetical protein [Alkalihalobacillus sp. MEB130]